MQYEPYVICGVITGVLSLLQEHWGIPSEPLLKAAGLDEDIFQDYDNHAPLNGLAIILEEASKQTNDKALVLKLTRLFETVAAGLINKYAAISAPTLRQALHSHARYSSLTFDLRKGEMYETNDHARIRWSYWKGFGGMQQFPNWIPGRLVTIMRTSLGENWKPLAVRLEHAAPEDDRPYRDMFGDNVKFNQTENYVAIKSTDLNSPMPEGDERLWKYIINLADEVSSRQSEENNILSVVKKQIIDALPKDQANIKCIADRLGKSPRTLQRDLNAAGTNFSKLLEQTRKDLADKYLLDSELHISQITFLLGFSEVSVFTRAANRWYGMSPSAYRQKKDVFTERI